MQRHDALKALDIYQRSGKQVNSSLELFLATTCSFFIYILLLLYAFSPYGYDHIFRQKNTPFLPLVRYEGQLFLFWTQPTVEPIAL